MQSCLGCGRLPNCVSCLDARTSSNGKTNRLNEIHLKITSTRDANETKTKAKAKRKRAQLISFFICCSFSCTFCFVLCLLTSLNSSFDTICKRQNCVHRFRIANKSSFFSISTSLRFLCVTSFLFRFILLFSSHLVPRRFFSFEEDVHEMWCRLPERRYFADISWSLENNSIHFDLTKKTDRNLCTLSKWTAKRRDEINCKQIKIKRFFSPFSVFVRSNGIIVHNCVTRAQRQHMFARTNLQFDEDHQMSSFTFNSLLFDCSIFLLFSFILFCSELCAHPGNRATVPRLTTLIQIGRRFNETSWHHSLDDTGASNDSHAANFSFAVWETFVFNAKHQTSLV